MTEASIQIFVPYHREEHTLTVRPVYVLCVHTSEGNPSTKVRYMLPCHYDHLDVLCMYFI